MIALWDQDENDCSATDDERKLKALYLLSDEIEKVAACNALHFVPAEQIRKLLRILRQPIQKGNIQAVQEENVRVCRITGLQELLLSRYVEFFSFQFTSSNCYRSCKPLQETEEIVKSCTLHVFS